MIDMAAKSVANLFPADSALHCEKSAAERHVMIRMWL